LFAEESRDPLAQVVVLGAQGADLVAQTFEALPERSVARALSRRKARGVGPCSRAEAVDLGAQVGVAVEQRAGHGGGLGDGAEGDGGAVAVEVNRPGTFL
jgi:hypothetical protein